MSEHAIVDNFMTGFLQKDVDIYKYTLSFWKSDTELI